MPAPEAPAVAPDSKYTSWPAWWYGPNGESEIFDSEEQVPDGWEDDPNNFKSKPAKAPKKEVVESPYKDKTDAEIILLLKERKIDFNERWPREKLENLLLEADKKG